MVRVASWELEETASIAKPSWLLYRAVAADSYELSGNGGSVDGNGRTLVGTFAIFNRPTEINSAVEGHFIERIAQGAFSKTIRENRDRIPVLFSHGTDPTLGLQSLGKVRDLREDSSGVHFEVALFRGLPELLLEGLREGAYGASFKARVIKDRFEPRPGRSSYNPAGLPEVTRTELALKEFGPTASPQYVDTSAAVRSITDEFMPARVTSNRPPSQRSLSESEKPSWFLDREPYWSLKALRKERHAFTAAREG